MANNILCKTLKAGLYSVAMGLVAASVGLTTPTMEEHNFRPPRKLESNEIRILSANVARGDGHDFNSLDLLTSLFIDLDKPDDGLDGLIDLIGQQEIDIGCFQEIENTYVRNQHQPRMIAEQTQLKHLVFSPNFAYNTLKFFHFTDGNAILSSATLFDSSQKLFEERQETGLATLTNMIIGSKGIVHSKVAYGENSLNVLCAHMSNWNTTFKYLDREKEFALLFEYAAKNTPAIIMGDFNTVPLSAQNLEYEGKKRYLGEKSWEIAEKIIKDNELEIQYDSRLAIFDRNGTNNFPATYTGAVPEGELGKIRLGEVKGRTIDYILLLSSKKDRLRMKLIDTKVYSDRYLSDHLPVIAEVELYEK